MFLLFSCNTLLVQWICACLGCHLSRYITLSYTGMEVGVVLARQRMQTLKYQTISTMHFFMSIRTEISLLNYHGKPGRQ